MANGTKDKFYSLSQISGGIRDAIYARFGEQPLWIVAEISDLSVRKGHCYLSLVEKLPGNAAPVCELKGIVWANKYERISRIFKEGTGTDLTSNTSILFQAVIRYDVKWGLSLVIEDIEPRYTVGLLQQERERTVIKLKAEGIYQNNKQLPFPLAPMRVAVISAKDSRGYEDFTEKLRNNPFGYRYEVTLFQSLLQGEKAASEMVSRLIEIFNSSNSYDVVAIVRGGGGAIDLNCFNDYKLARAVARFPLPVLTGIGHTANISIVDEVAFNDRITPTDAAGYLVERTQQFEVRLDNLSIRTEDAAVDIIIQKQQELMQQTNLFRLVLSQKLNSGFQTLTGYYTGLKSSLKNFKSANEIALYTLAEKTGSASKNLISLEKSKVSQQLRSVKSLPVHFLDKAQSRLNHFESSVNHLNPVNILKRGYSITQLNGKAIRDAAVVKAGDIIKTKLYEGTIESQVKEGGN